MSSTSDASHEAHADHGHDPYLAHHFADAEQQYDAAKMGMWTFLVTEILFFSGLFCAYTVYRSLYPELFQGAAKFLDTTLGATNTIVLLFSSLTMAWAVRCAQLGQKKGLVLTLALTLLCAFGFLGIKYMEYAHKFHSGLLPGAHYQAALHQSTEWLEEHGYDPHSHAPVPEAVEQAALAKDGRSYGLFFGIYFAMTGLHGIHVLAGIVVILFLLIRSLQGRIGPKNFTIVDNVGLYWHLVDMIWIFLFPLLYLIN